MCETENHFCDVISWMWGIQKTEVQNHNLDMQSGQAIEAVLDQ